jgi:hypothetical protein
LTGFVLVSALSIAGIADAFGVGAGVDDMPTAPAIM